MGDIFAVRNLDEKTKAEIQDYAHEHNLNMAQAIRELVFMALEHLKCFHKNKKKYKSFFEVYDKIKFKTNDPHLSENIDTVLYGKRDEK